MLTLEKLRRKFIKPYNKIHDQTKTKYNERKRKRKRESELLPSPLIDSPIDLCSILIRRSRHFRSVASKPHQTVTQFSPSLLLSLNHGSMHTITILSIFVHSESRKIWCMFSLLQIAQEYDINLSLFRLI